MRSDCLLTAFFTGGLMESVANYVLIYWAISGFLCAGLFANVIEADLSQHPQKGWQTPLVRNVLYVLFGGIILPLVVLIGGPVNAGAIIANYITKKSQKEQIKSPKNPTP
jgi:uncharacterized membrane protein HdeD (DUF308 family)